MSELEERIREDERRFAQRSRERWSEQATSATRAECAARMARELHTDFVIHNRHWEGTRVVRAVAVGLVIVMLGYGLMWVMFAAF